MLIAFMALIAMGDGLFGLLGAFAHNNGAPDFFRTEPRASQNDDILGLLFSPVAFVMGVPWSDAHVVGRLMGEKMVINEFVAYTELSSMLKGLSETHISQHAETIATFALCGFANLSSIAIQVGGIGEIAPSRRGDLARLGVKALICGTMASYLSATLAGLLA